jgi:hypothetical protein
MKNLFEKLVLAFLYVVTMGATLRMYAELISETKEFTLSALFNLLVIGIIFLFLGILSFIMLFTKVK